MARTVAIWLSVVCLLAFGRSWGAEPSGSRPDPLAEVVDSLVERAIGMASVHQGRVESYDAKLYVKGRVDVKKRNFLLRFIPTGFRFRKGTSEYLMETYSDLRFTAPDMYDQKVTACVGTLSNLREVAGQVSEYFHVDVYSPTLMYGQLLSPLSPEATKYYKFRLDSVWQGAEGMEYRIGFAPKVSSLQLVEGHLVLNSKAWTVREFHFEGYTKLIRFAYSARMGEVGRKDELLPVESRVHARFRFAGNVVEGDYVAVLDCGDVACRAALQEEPRRTARQEQYNLSDSYTLRCDTNAYRSDTLYFKDVRPVPLDRHEQALYAAYYARPDSARLPVNRQLQFWGDVGDMLTSRYTLNLRKAGSVRCSPVINPFLLSYSKRAGISYRQEFNYSRLFVKDRMLHVAPKIGYNFKRKEFYWSINANYDYWPSKRASLHVSVGNGNRIYSSDVLDDLATIPDSIFDFSQIHLDYFKDLYLRVNHTWEIVNGLTLECGFSAHRRTEVERTRFAPVYPDMPSVRSISPDGTSPPSLLPGIDPELLGRLRHTYCSFAPHVRLSWTYGMYYYMDGARKINLYSRYPTVSIDWERGISGVFHSTSNYDRIELDYQHNIRLGTMRSLYYRVGCGMFTNQENMYFVDFVNFSNNNLPIGWVDEANGVFQLLDGRWYNSSRKYARAHVTYEAPFLLMRHLLKYSKYVLNERLQANILMMPHLHPYLELGYSVGTHIFDFGVFASFANWRYEDIGCKFTFELFNR